MSDSVQKLKKKIWKISEHDLPRPSYKGIADSREVKNRDDSTSQKKKSSTSIPKKLAVSDLQMERLTKNKSMQFDSKKE